jgi:DNA-binding MarR family transcriptional regulator
MSKQYLSYEAKALRASTYRFLSREAHILIYLKVFGIASMKQVQLATGLSTRGFYLIAKKLEQSRLVSITDASDDKRKRLLALTPLGLDGVAKMPISS